MSMHVDTVVILAAGMGSRLQGATALPKPLLPLAGTPLVVRVLERFAAAGVSRAVVVTGHRAEEVRTGVQAADVPLDVAFVHNDRYRLSNGVSVLAAREAVGKGPFFLSMSDHIFDQVLITRLREASLPAGGLVLAVDRKLDAIFDEGDATKVATQDGRIVAIGKELDAFDAVDTGLFACTDGLFDALDAELERTGDCSLSAGVQALAAAGKALVHDIGDGKWQDVDTPEAAAHAARLFGL